MNLADWALRNRVTVLVFTFVMLGLGLNSFRTMSRLEDPEFTIKDALVITPYPGATAREVEAEVSDEIEIAAQRLGQLKELESKSDRGLSTVTVTIKDKYDKTMLPQVWDELRRKIDDAQGNLPPGAGPSIVVDDFGDVWGVFIAITGDGLSADQLYEVAKLLEREILLIDNVAKVEYWGERTASIYVEPNRDRMEQLGVRFDAIAAELQARNLVSDSGRIRVGPDYIAVEPTGLFVDPEDIGELWIVSNSGKQVRLRDIATVHRDYVEPQREILRYDGESAVGIGVSTLAGGNVVVMGDAIRDRVQEMLPQIPLGVEFGIISLQSDAVTTAINGFTVSLAQAVAIVVAVLLLFMGVRSGLLIGAVLVITIAGSFPFLDTMGVALERISLGALIIALGMLVDNAIVVTDGMLVRIQKGQDAGDAAREVVAQTALPLFGATVVAILAFAAIGTSDDNTGEFCRSLFQVVLVSLSLSWVTAVTVTPVLGVLVLGSTNGKSQEGDVADPYDSAFYHAYRSVVLACIRLRWLTVAVVIGVFVSSVLAFGRVDRTFFPESTRPQFMVDFWLPQGTHIDVTSERARRVEQYLAGLDGTTHVSTLVGNGAMRFLLTYSPEKMNSAYTQFLVDVEDYRLVPALIEQVEREIIALEPDSLVYGRKFVMGPGDGGKIQVRVRGHDHSRVRAIGTQVEDILFEDGGAKGIRSDWRQRTKQIRPVILEEEANLLGVTRADVASRIRQAFDGVTVGVYRDGDELLPIIVRAPADERTDFDQIRSIQVWSPIAGQTVPLRQVVSHFETHFEDDMIWRLDRLPTYTVHADPIQGASAVLLERIKPLVEAIELPAGTGIEWWGESRDSANAAAGLNATLPVFLGAMVLIVIALFNSLKQPAVIFLTVPLALIGVAWGLLLAGQPFGFMALLGFLSLSGMLIKNAIVLIDEIELQKRLGQPVLSAILDSGVSRLRPVAMAALTTALGMIPLLFDAFFIAMAVTIIAGLVVATILTMVVVPTLYAIFFNAPSSETAE